MCYREKCRYEGFKNIIQMNGIKTVLALFSRLSLLHAKSKNKFRHQMTFEI